MHARVTISNSILQGKRECILLFCIPFWRQYVHRWNSMQKSYWILLLYMFEKIASGKYAAGHKHLKENIQWWLCWQKKIPPIRDHTDLKTEYTSTEPFFGPSLKPSMFYEITSFIGSPLFEESMFIYLFLDKWKGNVHVEYWEWK